MEQLPHPIIEFFLPKEPKLLVFDFRFDEVKTLHRLGKIDEQTLIDYSWNSSQPKPEDVVSEYDFNYIINIKE
jgi:hypothetical protein